jgi:hypothetical protein
MSSSMAAGGVIFLAAVAAVVTFPFWYTRAGAAEAEPLVRPSGDACIESADVMRRTHMTMLHQWRDDVVRGDDPHKRKHVNSKGVEFDKSLTGTCLGCHESAQGFCNRCHERASVSITCFQCHTSVRADGAGHALSEASHGER